MPNTDNFTGCRQLVYDALRRNPELSTNNDLLVGVVKLVSDYKRSTIIRTKNWIMQHYSNEIIAMEAPKIIKPNLLKRLWIKITR